MKKNKMMRIAAVLLIVTLLSTCAISGTFAKYVTKADVEDSARVAKWGIKITTTGALFSDKYVADDDDYLTAGGTYSVEAKDGAMVVAPGTSSAQIPNGGFVASISGKPEVATRFQLKVNLDDIKDVFLPFGEGYVDYTKEVAINADGVEVPATFDLVGPTAADLGLNHAYTFGYSPVKWDIRVTRTKDDGTVAPGATSISLYEMAQEVAGTTYGPLFNSLFTADGISITDAKTVVQEVERLNLESMIMDKINEKFAGHGFRNLQISIDGTEIILSMDFDANENCNYRFEGGWAWDYEVDDDEIPEFVTNDSVYKAMIDQADTYLGNVAAGIITDVPADVSTDLKFNFEVSATQID